VPEPREQRAVMGRADRHDAPDGVRAVGAQVGTGGKPTHAVTDQRHALGARCGTEALDRRVDQFGIAVDRGKYGFQFTVAQFQRAASPPDVSHGRHVPRLHM